MRQLIARVLAVQEREAALGAASFERCFLLPPLTSRRSKLDCQSAPESAKSAILGALDHWSEPRVSQREPLNMLRDGRITSCLQLQSQVAWSWQSPFFEQRDVRAQHVD